MRAHSLGDAPSTAPPCPTSHHPHCSSDGTELPSRGAVGRKLQGVWVVHGVSEARHRVQNAMKSYLMWEVSPASPWKKSKPGSAGYGANTAAASQHPRFTQPRDGGPLCQNWVLGLGESCQEERTRTPPQPSPHTPQPAPAARALPWGEGPGEEP